MVPALSALACLYLMTNLSVETWLRFLAWRAVGMVVYLGYGRRRNRLARREQETPARTGSGAERGGRRGRPGRR